MTSESWAGPALAAVTERVGVIERAVGDRFPLYADPTDGTWTTTGRGAWTGGFWAGLLWLRALRTRTTADRRAAAACTARLEPWVGADTVTRGLILWYGTALADGAPAACGLGATGRAGTGIETGTGTGSGTGAALLRDRAARALLADRDPALGIVPWGGAFGGPRLLARADGVPGMVPLLATVAPDAAADHLRRHLDLCLDADVPPRAGADPEPDPEPELAPGLGPV
ncbi:hypothetical protein [Streptomyces sp. NPDC088915]|uniref:hypothetical protein n=1 Tax=Streptomyces sp. NPDC088915 TaxID=3365912 RepID=UPI003811E266